MARFTNESTKCGMKLTVDDVSKTVSITKCSSTATAATLGSVLAKFDVLMLTTPTKHTKTAVDLIETE